MNGSSAGAQQFSGGDVISSIWLNQFRHDVTSQNGEDGVLAAIFEKIGIVHQWCCEFGAWDGKKFSNTNNLITAEGWSGVLMEMDPAKFQELVRNMSPFPRVFPIHACVSTRSPDTLDEILSRTPIPFDFDLLSIDVDNDDYLIWQSCERYRPRVVVVEVNSGYPPGVIKEPVPEFRGSSHKSGASIESMVLLGKKKGYELALHNGNCIFVLREYCGQLDINSENWRELFDHRWIQTPYERALDVFKAVCRGPYRRARSVLGLATTK